MAPNRQGSALLLYLTIISSCKEETLDSLDTCPCQMDFVTHTVNCSDQDLTKVPGCVPNFTKELILSDNYFKELYPKEFMRFVYLRNLNFKKNFLQNLSIDSFQGLRNLRHLNLRFNEIHSLNTRTFIGLPRLQTLDFHFNGVKHIAEYCFSTLTHLVSLDLSFNRLSYLKPNTFHGLTSLHFLDLSYNNLIHRASFSSEVFKPLTDLQELNLKGICNINGNSTYIDKQLSQVPSLKRLYIDSLRNESFGVGFSSLKQLEELYIGDKLRYRSEYCVLGEVTIRTFENLRNTSLRKLSLKNCYIQIIQPYTFAYLRRLTILDVSDNYHLCRTGFKNLTIGLDSTNIKVLNLSGICKGLVSRWIFVPWTYEALLDTELETLDLSHCSASMGLNNMFLGLPQSLKHLYLQFNHVDVIRFYDINVLKKLLTLNLSHQTPFPLSTGMTKRKNSNQTLISEKLKQKNPTNHQRNWINNSNSLIKITQRSTFSLAPVLNLNESINAKGKGTISKFVDRKLKCWCLNALYSVDISYSGLLFNMSVLCNSTNSLEILNLSHQQHFFGLNEQFLNGYKSLWNNLKKLNMLRQLDMNNIGLKNIPVDAFAQQSLLRRLSVAENSLVNVGFDVNSLEQLEVLDLSDNSIQFASVEFTHGIENIAKRSNLTLFLDNNMLLCDCDRLAFVAWLQRTRVIFQKETLSCKYKNDSSMRLSEISEIYDLLKMECIAMTVLICCIVGFMMLVLISSLISVAYYKRWKFRYLLSVGRRNIHPYHPLEEGKVEMENDVYISYEGDYDFTAEQTLREFVIEKLYPQLKARGFEVLIREELTSGMKLYDVISKALRKSKKILVLLTDNYCTDYWNVFEFNIAVMEGIYTKRQTVIPVLLEALNPENLHEEVYAFLKSERVPRYNCAMNSNILVDYLSERIILE